MTPAQAALPKSATTIWNEFVRSNPLPEAFDKPHVKELRLQAYREEQVDNSWDFSTIYDDNGAVVASVPINHLVTEDSQDRYEPIKEANARLIAASPCLLEALTELVEFADKMTGRVEPEYRQIAVARAIIAKARGHE